MRGDPDIWRLLPDDLGIAAGVRSAEAAQPLSERCVLVLVGLTGAGKTTTVERLVGSLPLAAILPDRRALTDRIILPSMAGGTAPVADRVERFRLTAAFKQRYPGGMGEVLSWLLLPPDLPPGAVLFDGLRGEAEVTAAAALPRARFVVLDCPPEGRLWRLCGRNDPFDRASIDRASIAVSASGTVPGSPAVRQAMRGEGFDAVIDAETFEVLAGMLADRAVEPAVVARSAAIIVEESRHYDPARARAALQRLAPERTLVLDTGALDPQAVATAIQMWLEAA